MRTRLRAPAGTPVMSSLGLTLVPSQVNRAGIMPPSGKSGLAIFMAAGSHVKKDLPRLAADAMDRHAGLLIELAAPVGEAESVLAAMADYAIGAGPLAE